VAGIACQPALSRVTAAAEAGLLPDQLDDAGLRNALDVLLTHPGLPDVTIDAAALAARYLRLSEVLREPLPDVVDEAVTRTHIAGILPVASYSDRHPLDDADDDDGAASVPDWWRRALAAGRREEAEIPCPYPAGTVVEDGVLIDIALDTLEAGGDLDTYESTLETISAGEPRDIDAYALARPTSRAVCANARSIGILSRRFDAGFTIGLMTKDLLTALELAHDVDVDVPLSARTVELWQQALAALEPDADHTATASWFENEHDLMLAEMTPDEAPAASVTNRPQERDST
jgi:hypothetical protein